MNMCVEKFSEGLTLHSFTPRTSLRCLLDSDSQHATRGPYVARRNYACGQYALNLCSPTRAEWFIDLVNFARLGKFGKQYLICNGIRLCYTENVVFWTLYRGRSEKNTEW